ATYAVFGSAFDASMRTTHCPRAGSGKLFVTSVHLPPSFSVIQRRPSSVPAQSNPARLGDSASEKTTPNCPSARDCSGLERMLGVFGRSEEHTSELQSRFDLVCRLLLE